MSRCCRVLLAALLGLALAGCTTLPAVRPMAAGSPVRLIRSDTTLSGTVVIRGELTVLPGATLTLAPGARLSFEPLDSDGDGLNDSALVVRGRLVARGEPDGYVVFTSAAADPGPQDWRGIVLEDAAGCLLKRCVVEHARLGLHARSSSGIVVDSTFRGNHDAALFEDSRFRLTANQFMENRGVGLGWDKSRLLVRENYFYRNSPAIGIATEDGGSDVQLNRFVENNVAEVRLGETFQGPLPDLGPETAPPHQLGNYVWDNQLPPGPHDILRVSGPGEGKERLRRAHALPREQRHDTTTSTPFAVRFGLRSVWKAVPGAAVDFAPVSGYSLVGLATAAGDFLQLDPDSGREVARTRLGSPLAAPIAVTGRYPSAGREASFWFHLLCRDGTIHVVQEGSGEDRIVFTGRPTAAARGRQLLAMTTYRGYGEKIRSAGWQDVLVALSGENELVALGAGEGKLLWRQAIDGEVASLLCTTSTVFAGTREGVLRALKRTDGTERWRLALGTPLCSAPALIGDEGRVVVLGDNGLLYSIAGGKVLWSRLIAPRGGCAPAVVYRWASWDKWAVVIVADGYGRVSAVDPDGTLVWRTELGSAVRHLTVLEPGGSYLSAGTEEGEVVLLDPSTGEILLRTPVGAADLASFGHGEKNTLFAAFADGRLEAFDPWYEMIKVTPPRRPGTEPR